MDTSTVADEAAHYLQILADPDSEPGAMECLACFVARMLDKHGCDTSLRWATWFRDRRSPTATGLVRRLGDVGGFCDCEIFVNGWRLRRELMVRDLDTDELEEPDTLPDCARVRRTSTQPCVNWEKWRQRGGSYGW